MAWLIGIDEAGYGPNLGPFVMTLAACQVPDELHEANLWDVLKSNVRGADEPADHRFIVADSENPKKNMSYLMVSKIGKTESCVTDVVLPGAKQNETARQLADAASSKPCKKQD